MHDVVGTGIFGDALLQLGEQLGQVVRLPNRQNNHISYLFLIAEPGPPGAALRAAAICSALRAVGCRRAGCGERQPQRLVVALALLWMAQRIVRLVEALHLRMRVGCRVQVRMELAGKLSIGSCNLGLRSVAPDLQNFIVARSHAVQCSTRGHNRRNVSIWSSGTNLFDSSGAELPHARGCDRIGSIAFLIDVSDLLELNQTQIFGRAA